MDVIHVCILIRYMLVAVPSSLGLLAHMAWLQEFTSTSLLGAAPAVTTPPRNAVSNPCIPVARLPAAS